MERAPFEKRVSTRYRYPVDTARLWRRTFLHRKTSESASQTNGQRVDEVLLRNRSALCQWRNIAAVTISIESATPEAEETNRIHLPDKEDRGVTETFYVATNHGVYKIQDDTKGIRSRIGITNGALLGKQIQTLTAGESVIYAGTQEGLYRYYSVLPDSSTEMVSADGNIRRIRSQIWHKVEGTPFDTASVQAINALPWDSTRLYVGTPKGLYTSQDAGQTWTEVAPTI